MLVEKVFSNLIGNAIKYSPQRADIWISVLMKHEQIVFSVENAGVHMENASRHYNIEKVRSIIESEKSKYGWEFLFLGANIDAIETARHIGIDADHAADYCCDSVGTAINYECLNKAVSAVRCAAPMAPMGAAWKKDIEEGVKRRKK